MIKQLPTYDFCLVLVFCFALTYHYSTVARSKFGWPCDVVSQFFTLLCSLLMPCFPCSSLLFSLLNWKPYMPPQNVKFDWLRLTAAASTCDAKSYLLVHMMHWIENQLLMLLQLAQVLYSILVQPLLCHHPSKLLLVVLKSLFHTTNVGLITLPNLCLTLASVKSMAFEMCHLVTYF